MPSHLTAYTSSRPRKRLLKKETFASGRESFDRDGGVGARDDGVSDGDCGAGDCDSDVGVNRDGDGKFGG